MIRTWWAVTAVLAIFVMHGLATHASPHNTTPATTPIATPIMTAGTAHATSTSDDPHGSPAAAAEDGGHGEHGQEASVLGLCLAMLASAAILLLRLGRPRRGLLALLPPAALTASLPVSVARGPSPPDLHALSVLRC